MFPESRDLWEILRCLVWGREMKIIPKMLIDGTDVSQYLVSIKADQGVSHDTAESQKFDVVLADPRGDFFQKWGKKSKIICDIEYVYDRVSFTGGKIVIERRGLPAFFATTGEDAADLMNGGNVGTDWPLFRGELQDVKYSSDQIKINGSCKDATAAQSPKEVLTKLNMAPEDLVDFAVKEFDMKWPDGKVYIDTEVKGVGKKHTFTIRSNLCGQDMMDYAANWAGAMWFTDERGDVIFCSPKGSGLLFDLRGIVQFPEGAYNAIGYCNQVTVVGGNPEQTGTMPAGSPTATNMQEAVGLIYTTPKPSEEEIAKYGWIPAPIFCEPSLTTKEKIKEAAEKRLKYYKKNQDVCSIVCIGFSPPLRSYVLWDVNFLWAETPSINFAPDIQIKPHPISGMVTRKVTNWSIANGFTCNLEVSTKVEKPSGGVMSITPDPFVPASTYNLSGNITPDISESVPEE